MRTARGGREPSTRTLLTAIPRAKTILRAGGGPRLARVWRAAACGRSAERIRDARAAPGGHRGSGVDTATWLEGAFENDTAHELAHQLVESDDLSVIELAIDAVLDSGGG